MNPDQSKVFVGGIPWETSELRLKEYFGAFGDVVEAVIMKDRATGRARGFGFVEFSDPSLVERVLTEKHTIDGRLVEVKKAVRKEEHHQNAYRMSSSSSSSSSPPVHGATGGRTRKIFVGGLASTVTEEDFRGYFGQFGAISDVVVMYDHATQRPRGFGFITFETEEGVESAVQKKFHELHDKTVEVKRAVPKELSSSGGGRSAGGVGVGVGGAGPASRGAAGGYGGYSVSSPAQQHVYNTGAQYGCGVRGGFAPYGPLYGAPAYGYGLAMMNGGAASYGASSYGAGPAAAAAAYAAAPPPPPPGSFALGFIGPPSPGYGASSGAAPRSPWLAGHSAAGSSGAAYAANSATYGSSLYGTPPPWTPAQSPGNVNPSSLGYNNGSYGYGGGAAGMNTVYGFGDAYSAAAAAAASYGGVGAGDSSSSPHAAASAPSSSSSGADLGLGIAGARQAAPRIPEARFRPYPPPPSATAAAGERVA